MKKLFFVVALLAVVASCTKNEVIPQNDGNKEITYLTAPLTKAHSAFETSNKFYSYAYLLTSGNEWASASNSSTPYINEALISYHTPVPPATPVWKASQSYYWPKDEGSSLTFFAWSNGTGTLDPTVGECSKANGVQFPNYNVTTYKNKDMMVAKIAEDQKANDDVYKYDGVTQGVPTLFYHVLSSLAFQAKTDQAYTGYTFKVKSITFNNVCVKGTYAQGVDIQYLPTGAPVSGTGTPKDVWTKDGSTTATTLDLFTASDAAGTQIANDGSNTTPLDHTKSTGSEYTIMLPHTLEDSETVTIVYTVFNGLALEEVTLKNVKLNDIFTEGWLPGKKYTLTITLSLNEILWDPAVENWTEGTGTWGI